jgi:O-methyltransferase involved in polyketide biosynthesis
MYLPRRSVSECLEQLTEICAPGSRLLMTYLEADALPGGWLGERVTRTAFAAIGEPLKSAYTPWEMRALLEPNWALHYDDSALDWQRMTGSEARARPALRAERLVVARRR